MNPLSLLKKYTRKTQNEESAFTLVELMITVLVISVLVAVSLLVYADQQRLAIVATVRHDVDSNKSIMAPGSGSKLYLEPAKFLPAVAETSKNTAYYTVNDTRSDACTHSSYAFSEDDVVYWRLWTSVGKQEPLPCPDLGGGSVTVPPPGGGTVGGDGVTPPVVTTPTPTPTPTTPGGGNPENNDGGYGTDPIRPGNSVTTIQTIMTSNETYRVCYNVRVNTTSTTGAPWSVYIDKTKAPFADGNFIEGLNDSRYHMVDNGNHYLLYGSQQMENASVNTTISPSFCSKAPNNLPVIPKAISSLPVTVGTVNGNQYHATQNFTVGNSSQYYSGWSVQVDMTDLIDKVSGKPGQEPFVDTDVSIMSIQRVSGNIYEIRSVISYRSIKDGNNYTFTVRYGK